MSGHDDYQAIPIPPRPESGGSDVNDRPALHARRELPLDADPFSEIELLPLGLDEPLTAIPRVQPIPAREPSVSPEIDLILERFRAMRKLAYRSDGLPNFRAESFIKQARFMADFEDDYEETKPFHEFYPYYQLMNIAQLRTYFTWRTKLRQGLIEETSLSYVYLYLYECLNLIGVADETRGLEHLLDFRDAYAVIDHSIDEYFWPWVKDYFIYYGDRLPYSFHEFMSDRNLQEHYPEIFIFGSDESNSLDYFAAIGTYPIKQSIFYTAEAQDDLRLCFFDLLTRIRAAYEQKKKVFEAELFASDGKEELKEMLWIPFARALYIRSGEEQDRSISLSPVEFYRCRQRNWTYHPALLKVDGIAMVSYLLKETERQLRMARKFKYKLSEPRLQISLRQERRLKQMALNLPDLVRETVQSYLKKQHRIEVEVLPLNLERIRVEAMDVQEKLTVDDATVSVPGSVVELKRLAEPDVESDAAVKELIAEPEARSPWAHFRASLTADELELVKKILRAEDSLAYIRKLDIMPEVFIDRINQKAFDCVGDAIIEIDTLPRVYEDYENELEEMVKLC